MFVCLKDSSRFSAKIANSHNTGKKLNNVIFLIVMKTENNKIVVQKFFTVTNTYYITFILHEKKMFDKNVLKRNDIIRYLIRKIMI